MPPNGLRYAPLGYDWGEQVLELDTAEAQKQRQKRAQSQPSGSIGICHFAFVPVLFNQKDNSFTVEASIVNTPILLPNPNLLEYFEKYAESFLADMDLKNEHTRAVTKIILSRLDDETLSINKVAREMAVSVRTVQKRLEEEGVVFSDLYKDVRQRLAQKYLCENYTVEQITYLLGFSEPSVFRKAFKKWSGFTPREYRERAFATRTRI